jgi:hypothetical protein
VDTLDEDQLLQYCPRCAYQVRGLPVEHCCPECAFAFDRRWRVFGGATMYPNRAWWQKPGFALLAILMPMFVIMGTVSAMLRQGWPLAAPLGAALLIGIMVARRPRKFIALAPDALLVYHGRGQWDRYPWPAVGRAKNDILHKSIAWDFDGQTVRHPAIWIFGMDVPAIDQCVRAINAHPRTTRPTAQ